MSGAGRVALVTGGGRGIGRAIALRLAQDGVAVAINYRGSAEAAAETVRQITDAGGRALAIAGDVAAEGEAARLVAEAVSGLGRLDILVNNAGITRDNLTMRMSEADWDAVLTTNLKGAFLCAKAALRPLLKARASGRIISISSVVGIVGNAGQANYSAAKAGLIGLTKSLAKEVASRGITVNAVAPRLHQHRHDRRPRRRGAGGDLEGDPARSLRRPVRHRRGGRLPRLPRRALHHRPGTQRRWWDGDVTKYEVRSWKYEVKIGEWMLSCVGCLS